MAIKYSHIFFLFETVPNYMSKKIYNFFTLEGGTGIKIPFEIIFRSRIMFTMRY